MGDVLDMSEGGLSHIQVIITASQIQWTADCEKALDRGDKKGLKSIRKKQVTSNGWLNSGWVDG